MLPLLYSKILWVYKHLMIAYYEKVFFKKLMQLDINATPILWLEVLTSPAWGEIVRWPGPFGRVCALWSCPSLSPSL